MKTCICSKRNLILILRFTMLSFVPSISSHEETPQIYVNQVLVHHQATTFIGIGTLTPAVSESADFRRGVVATRCWLVDMIYRKIPSTFWKYQPNTQMLHGTGKVTYIYLWMWWETAKCICFSEEGSHNLAEKQKPLVSCPPRRKKEKTSSTFSSKNISQNHHYWLDLDSHRQRYIGIPYQKMFHVILVVLTGILAGG